MKRIFLFAIALVLCASLCEAQMRGNRMQNAPSPLQKTGDNEWTLPGSIGFPSSNSGVSSYGDCKTSVTPDLTKEVSVIYLAGANATTGVSIVLGTPTLPVGQWQTKRTFVIQQSAANICLATWPGANIQAPSGTSPALTPTTGATDWVTALYNTTTKKWTLIDGPYDVR